MYHVPLKVDVAAAHWLLYILLSNILTSVCMGKRNFNSL